MKNKRNILLLVGLVAFALVCVFGGQALVKHSEEQRLAELQAQQSQSIESPVATPENIVYTLPPAVTYTLPPAATGSSAPAVDDVKTDEDGNVTITPDFENQGNEATEVINPGAQVTANVGGGGGTVPMESDGAYHGESQPPAATPSPAPSAPPASTPKPTATPKPAQTPPPETTPSPEPDNSNGGPPNRKGSYDGEISPDRKYIWDDLASKWYSYAENDGGTGGQIDDSDQGWGWGEGGETVGSFG